MPSWSTGDLRPEAFSVDGQLVFALDYRGDHYRVQTIDLATGDRYDTSDRDKTLPPEDMNGAAVRGVLSADRTLLATLYRNPGDADEPAFVHVLDLQNGWSYCADLPPPFGTGAVGSDCDRAEPGRHGDRLDGERAACRRDPHRRGSHPGRSTRHGRLPRRSHRAHGVNVPDLGARLRPHDRGPAGLSARFLCLSMKALRTPGRGASFRRRPNSP